MKLAISNIAWERDEEADAAQVMIDLGVKRVEIAPTKAWDVPLEATDSEIAAYREWWSRQGIEIVALQSLNFGHPEFQIFQGEPIRQDFLEYLQGVTALGAKLGAKVMVFGSPKNRLIGERSVAEAQSIAVEFFRKLGETAAGLEVSFCIEPNPTAYGCDFVTDTASGIELVKAVNHPGFGLHLDAAGLTLAGDNPQAAITGAAPYLRHFHLSEPYLNEVGPGKVDHASIAKALESINYEYVKSIEMKAAAHGTNVPRVRRVLQYIQTNY